MFHALVKLALGKGEGDNDPRQHRAEKNKNVIIESIIGTRLLKIESLRKNFFGTRASKAHASVKPATDGRSDSIDTPSIIRLSSQQALIVGARSSEACQSDMCLQVLGRRFI
jgi:hypothetical protein